MADMNRVAIIGRLTKDAEIKESNDGKTAYGTFTIASNRRVKNGDKWEDKASYFDIKAGGAMYKSIGPYLKKGRQIGVSGMLVQDRWEKDGKSYSAVRISAESIQLLAEGKDQGQQSAPKPAPAPKSNGPESFESSDFDDLPDF